MLVSDVRCFSWACLNILITEKSAMAVVESAAAKCSPMWIVEASHCHRRLMQVVRRTWDWLAEQPEDAAELALLLFEAAPKLNFGEAGPSRAASAKMPRRASAMPQGGFRRRLTRAVPMAPGGALTAPPASVRQLQEPGQATESGWDPSLS